jgi:very-short-patch-repair endonuclease
MCSRRRSSLNKIEQKVYDILKRLNVTVEAQMEIDKYNVDFLVNDKYIIECYGDFWHCNPNKYAPNYFNRGKKKTAQDIWDRDLSRKQLFEQLGYKFIHLWEMDINGHPKKVKAKLKRYLGE